MKECNPKTNTCNSVCCKVLAFRIPGIDKNHELRKFYLRPGFFAMKRDGLEKDEHLKEYYEKKGIVRNKDVLTIPCLNGSRIVGETLLINHVCPHLKDNKCMIYETRPYLCKIFKGQEGYFIPKECIWNEKGFDYVK